MGGDEQMTGRGGERSATDSAWMDDGSNSGDGVMTEGQRWVAMVFGRNELSVFIGRRSMCRRLSGVGLEWWVQVVLFSCRSLLPLAPVLVAVVVVVVSMAPLLW